MSTVAEKHPYGAHVPLKAMEPYAGYMVGRVVNGEIDGGAAAVDTVLAKVLGYTWRHHSADFKYLEGVRDMGKAMGRGEVRVPRTLFVHN